MRPKDSSKGWLYSLGGGSKTFELKVLMRRKKPEIQRGKYRSQGWIKQGTY